MTQAVACCAACRQIALENAKNYQLWNHRRKLAQALGPSAVARELAFAAEALELDEKNYHAWAHRQSVVAQGACWQEELQYSAYMIDKDVRNNSAWNQRFFVLQVCAQVQCCAYNKVYLLLMMPS